MGAERVFDGEGVEAELALEQGEVARLRGVEVEPEQVLVDGDEFVDVVGVEVRMEGAVLRTEQRTHAGPVGCRHAYDPSTARRGWTAAYEADCSLGITVMPPLRSSTAYLIWSSRSRPW